MAQIEWMLRGPELVTCNCDFGCPCQFNALPTHGHCRAALTYRIDEGYFGDVRLDGVRFCALVAWPGAIHEGGGDAQPIVDERASAEQRAAVLKIFRGEETEPGATIFNVFSAVIERYREPLYLPIDFEVDIEERVARVSIPGILEVKGEPIRNPVTGQPHRARIELPDGFEYTVAEMGSTTTKTGDKAPIPLEWTNGHGQFATLHWTRQGVVR
ncbi:MAG: DUF1326 domain-containing protein [Geminicoccales bacterium]